MGSRCPNGAGRTAAAAEAKAKEEASASNPDAAPQPEHASPNRSGNPQLRHNDQAMPANVDASGDADAQRQPHQVRDAGRDGGHSQLAQR